MFVHLMLDSVQCLRLKFWLEDQITLQFHHNILVVLIYLLIYFFCFSRLFNSISLSSLVILYVMKNYNKSKKWIMKTASLLI